MKSPAPGLRLSAAILVAFLAALALLAFVSLTLGRGRPFARRHILPFFAQALLRIFGISIERLGSLELPSEPCFFIANHTSGLDVLVVAALGLPNARFFISRSTLPCLPLTLANLALGTFFLSEQYEPEKRRREFMKATQTLGRTGESAFLTPEGVRVRSGRIGHFNKAAFHMATLLGRPIIPLFIEVPRNLDPGMGHRPEPGTIRVHFRPALSTTRWRIEEVEANAARVRELYLELHAGLYGPPRAPEKDAAALRLPRARARHLRCRLRLGSHLLRILAGDLVRRRISLSDFRFVMRRQRVISRVFSHAKHARVGDKVFMDPFAPHFPSPHFTRVVRNFTHKTFPLKPNYAQIAITNHCPCACFHCHVQNTHQGDLPRALVLSLIAKLSQAGFPMLFFVGGEPLSRFEDLVAFVEAASPHMDTRIFTSGVGTTRERLSRLRQAGLVGIYVSLDHHQESFHNQKRAHPQAFRCATETIRQAVELGFYVSVVCCTTAAMVRDGSFRKVVDLAEALGAHAIQLNEIRPVGEALNADPDEILLSPADKEALVHYYRECNLSPRRIAIAMPWYLEEPQNLGCTATSGQKIYIDGHGNVQPCELLKVSLGNVRERDFLEIWEEFRSQCHHPVRECIVWSYNALLGGKEPLPLTPAKTRSTWPAMTALPPAHLYREIFACLPPESQFSLQYFEDTYDLEMRQGRDFHVREEHWIPRALGAEYVALGKTLFSRSRCPAIPDHEFLHLAQFRKKGVARVLAHYVFHGVRNMARERSFKEAFRAIPFEREARAYERLRVEAPSSPALPGGGSLQ